LLLLLIIISVHLDSSWLWRPYLYLVKKGGSGFSLAVEMPLV